MDEKEQMKLLSSICSRLSEHFENVQIFVSKAGDEPGMTAVAHWGTGNFFARYGQVKAWLMGEEALMLRRSEE